MSEQKEYISNQIYLDEEYIKKFVSDLFFLKPSLTLFEKLRKSNPVIKQNTYFYIYAKLELRVKVFSQEKLNEVKNILLDNSKTLGGYSVSIVKGEVSLLWPPVTQQRIEQVKKRIQQSEVELLDLLRKKRQNCRNELFKDSNKEQKKEIEKKVEDIFLKEKKKIQLNIQKILSQL